MFLSFYSCADDAIILSDVVKGTGWRGCKMSATNEQMNQRVYGWRHSLCPYGVCHIPTLNVEVGNHLGSINAPIL